MSLLTENEFGRVYQAPLLQGLTALVIEHAKGTAKVSLYGGQVLSWQPCGEKDVFWLSKNSHFQQGKAIRGGIPLCWPWFGQHPDDSDNQWGNHGFARSHVWQLDAVKISEQGVELSLLWQGENMAPLWPYPCQLTQGLFFGDSFKQTLKMHNLSEQDAYYTGALHSYFSVSSPENIKVAALENAAFNDKLTGKLSQPQPIENGVGPVDRIYHTCDVMTIVDRFWQRSIVLKAKNTHQWVFWNPGVETASNMADIHPQGEQEFVCLEAANTQNQLLKAGQYVTMEQEVFISRI